MREASTSRDRSNPSVQTFGEWLARNKSKIPLA